MTNKRHAENIERIFARRLREARQSKRWTQQDLADAMQRVGHPINRVAIAKIEKGAQAGLKPGETAARAASLPEAIAFAVALGVSPLHLFLPIEEDVDVQLTSKVTVRPDRARAWARGRRPLDMADAKFYEFQSPSEPTWEEEEVRRQEQSTEKENS